jgi:hypothetical protein
LATGVAAHGELIFKGRLPMAELKNFKEDDWILLIDRIKDKGCTPFIGPGVHEDGFERLSALARGFAQRWDYPLEDSGELARVGRFVSAKFSVDYARARLLEEYQKLPPPDYSDELDPHVILASLPFPVYITTNHDDSMTEALRRAERLPQMEICRWKESISYKSPFLGEHGEPAPATPVVFHFYGYPYREGHKVSPESLVYTEDDYFEFLLNVASDEDTIPLPIRKAMSGTSLLFLGYRLDDWDFRVLFHLLLAKYLRVDSRVHVSVQVPIGEARPEEQRRKIEEFFDRYITSKRLDIRVYRGTSRQFTRDLKKRLESQ